MTCRWFQLALSVTAVLFALPLAGGSAAAQVLINGGTVVAHISDPAEEDCYGFFANAGEGIQARLVDNFNVFGFFPTLRLLRPDGTEAAFDADHQVAVVAVEATMTGTYTLVVSHGATTPFEIGHYNLHFVHAPLSTGGGSLTNGVEIISDLIVGDLDAYTFTINAGEKYRLRVGEPNATSVSPEITLYDSTGSEVGHASGALVADVNGQALLTGTYTVVVANGNANFFAATGPYSLHFVRIPGASELGLLRDGVPKTGSIDRGDIDSFTFLATAGQSAQIIAMDTATPAGSLAPRIYVYGPMGQLIGTARGSVTATLTTTILDSGIHTIVLVDDSQNFFGTGPYSIVVNGSGNDPALVPNIVCAPEFPTDPTLIDNGGNATLGPKIGDANEPFNFAIDCTGASQSSFYALELWSSKRAVPASNKWGLLYLTGMKWFATIGGHSQSIETWFPVPNGLPVPNDSALVGLPYTVQGFCGGFTPKGRMTDAVTQTIGF